MLCLTHRVRFGGIPVKSVPHIALVECLSLQNSYAILASSKVVFPRGELVMKCSNCGTQLPPGAVACPMCGTPTPQYGFGSGATPYDPTVASSYNTPDTPLSATPPPPTYDPTPPAGPYGASPSTAYGSQSYSAPPPPQYMAPYVAPPPPQYTFPRPPPPSPGRDRPWPRPARAGAWQRSSLPMAAEWPRKAPSAARAEYGR